MRSSSNSAPTTCCAACRPSQTKTALTAILEQGRGRPSADARRRHARRAQSGAGLRPGVRRDLSGDRQSFRRGPLPVLPRRRRRRPQAQPAGRNASDRRRAWPSSSSACCRRSRTCSAARSAETGSCAITPRAALRRHSGQPKSAGELENRFGHPDASLSPGRPPGLLARSRRRFAVIEPKRRKTPGVRRLEAKNRVQPDACAADSSIDDERLYR